MSILWNCPLTPLKRKVSGLTVCGLLAAWLFAANVSSRIDDAQGTADDAAYTARQAADKGDELERRVDDLERYRPY